MSKADSKNTTPLSSMFKSSELRSVFWRAEQDLGDDYAAMVMVDILDASTAAPPSA
jgi:hypothetical protein